MKRLIDRVYARQCLSSFQRNVVRHSKEFEIEAGWAVFFLIVVLGLLASGLLG